MKIAILGAGIAGTHLYSLLKKQHHTLTLFEKSRGAGGRCSTRYIDDFKIDHGTPFFEASNLSFKDYCDSKVDENILQKKEETYYPIDGINKLCSYSLNSDEFIKNTKIVSCEYNGMHWNLTDKNGVKYTGFDKVIITIPAPQILELQITLDERIKSKLLTVKYDSIATLMIYSNTLEELDSKQLLESGMFKKIVDNSKKYNYEDISSYILHLNATLTNAQKFTNKQEIQKYILDKIYEITGEKIEDKFHIMPHFWKYGFVSKFLDMPYIYDDKTSLGFCGDYFMGENLQSSFLSAQKLYEDKLSIL